jgi:hypothetical protein
MRQLLAAGAAALVAALASATGPTLVRVSSSSFDAREPGAAWRVDGSAALMQGPEGAFVRLTPDERQQRGVLYCATPAAMLGEAWRIDTTFRVHGVGTLLFGDGLSLHYSRSAPVLGPALGGPASYTGVSLLVDTYPNTDEERRHAHPYVSLVANDGTEQATHDEARGSLSSLHAPAGCSAPEMRAPTRAEPVFVTLRLEYAAAAVNDGKNALSVLYAISSRPFSPRADADFKPCVGTMDPGLPLPRGYMIGVAASTGSLSDAHDVYSVDVYGETGGADTQGVSAEVLQGWEGEAQAAAARGRALAGQPAVEAAADDAMPVAPAERPPPAPPAPVDLPAPPAPAAPAEPARRTEGSVETGREAAAAVDTLRARMEAANRKFDDLERSISARVDQAHEHMEDVMERLVLAEAKLDGRLQALEEAVKARLRDLEGGTEEAARSWVRPFLGLAGIALALTVGVIFQSWRLEKLKEG